MAFSIATRDIRRNTWLQRDLQSGFGSAGAIGYRLTGGSDANTDLDGAIDEVVANGSSLFPGTSIPLARCHATYLNDTDVKVIATHRISPWGGPSPPSVQVVARVRVALAGFQWYSLPYEKATPETQDFTGGFPSGDLDFPHSSSKSINHPPRPWVWEVPLTTVVVWGVWASNETTTVEDKIGKTNSGTVTWAGHSWAANQLRFDSLNVDWIKEDGADKYAFQYVFNAHPAAWEKQSLDEFDATNGWTVIQGGMYEQTSFTAGIPTS